MDLRGLLRAGDWLRVLALAQRLPPGCRTHVALYGEEAPFDRTQYVLADMIDVLQGANWQRAGDRNAKKPTPYHRPNPMRLGSENLAEQIREAQQRHARRKRRLRARNRSE